MVNTLALILAGGQGQRLNILSEWRAKPAVPFGGKYRLIDFTLSNCVHSGIIRVALLTQYRPRSLQQHIEIGRPWDLDRMNGGVSLLQPSLGRGIKQDWYQGTADAVYQNLSSIQTKQIRNILILSGDHIYKMDYSQMLEFHQDHNAALTIAVMPVELKDASRFGILQLDDNQQIIDFEEKPKAPKSNLASMGIYMFNRNILENILQQDAGKRDSSHDFGKDIIPQIIKDHPAYGWVYNGYWRDVGTISSYFESNMDLLEEPPLLDLDDENWPILTKNEERPPVHLDQEAKVIQSLVANGCIVNGYVEHSILFPGVTVESGAIVHNSIIFPDTYIGPDSKINHSIIDKKVIIGKECRIGAHDRNNLPQDGITVVGKGSRIPPRMDIGGGCIIDSGLLEEDFISTYIPDGDVFKKKDKNRNGFYLNS